MHLRASLERRITAREVENNKYGHFGSEILVGASVQGTEALPLCLARSSGSAHNAPADSEHLGELNLACSYTVTLYK
jgi:hypothetical protein